MELLAFGMPGPTEWIIILLVVLLFFGAAKLPQLMRSMGTGIKEFKSGLKEGEEEAKKEKEAREAAEKKESSSSEPEKQ